MDDLHMENATEDKREEIKQKLRQYYDGRIVRKDLTKSIREGANVPVYVLEYLLGQYCNSDDDEIIEEGVENVKRILRDNYVRPDEAQKILSLLRERGSYTVIDRITVVLNTKEDRYEATKDYIINYQDMQGIGMTGNLALPTLIAICSAALGKTPLNSLAILGEISIGGTLIKVDELASTLQVCLDSGAKKVLLPITSAGDLGTVPSDLVGAFSLIFYSSAEEAVFKALGVE